MLDQIFQDAHKCYDDIVTDLKYDLGPDVGIGIFEAIQVFVEMNKKPWCSRKQRERGFKVVGLAENRVSIDFMPEDSFLIGEAIAAAAEGTAEGAQDGMVMLEAADPEDA